LPFPFEKSTKLSIKRINRVEIGFRTREIFEDEPEAYKEAEGIKGEGDAGAMHIYAQAFEKDPDFYKFLRTLQCYEKFLDEKTTILLPGDMELLELLERRETGTSHGKK